MRMVDFQYNGRTLSSFGLMPCMITNTDTDGIAVGVELTFNTVKNNNSQRNYSTTSTYSDTLTMTFDVMKNPCASIDDAETISGQQIRQLASWLQRRDYKIFRAAYEDAGFGNVFFKGSFTTISAIKNLNGVVGLSLTFTADSPFGYGDKISQSSNSEKGLIVKNDNDEYGCYYPAKFIVKCVKNGDLHISNSAESKRETVVRNCKSGEVITFQCPEKIITSSLEGHLKLYNDFNYIFPRLVKTDDESTTINQFITGISNNGTYDSNVKNEISISYYPIRKVGLIV